MQHALLIVLLTAFCYGADLQPPTGQTRAAHGLKVPIGFEVVEFADQTLANDIYRLTVDPRGRIVAAGRGYIRILVDDNGDGRANRAIQLADFPKDGAMGLLWEGDQLFFAGDGGLKQVRVDKTGERLEGPARLIRAMKTGGEHETHAIRRGPDGWLYVLCGNMTGVNRSFAQTAMSPIADPVAGCVIRFSPDLKTSEIVADGFRNAYGFDFNADGELFAFDSDNERCVSLPWYEPTRFYHVIEAGHYGWRAPQRSESWRYPPYFADVVAPAATLGRGSPTGIAFYRHLQFPARYRNGAFLLDWTFGKIYFLTLERNGSSYQAKSEIFLEPVGETGFAPTDIVVHPATGDLYVSIGGRGTRGAVYRIRFAAGKREFTQRELQTLQPKSRSLDWRPELLTELSRDAEAADMQVRRRALEMIRRHRERLFRYQVDDAIKKNWSTGDRYVRLATVELLADRILAFPDSPIEPDFFNDSNWAKWTFNAALERIIAVMPKDRVLEFHQKSSAGQTIFDVFLVRDGSRPLTIHERERLLAWIRYLQIVLGDLAARWARGTVWEGYSSATNHTEKAVAAGRNRPFSKITIDVLAGLFPTGDPDVDRELTRTLAMFEFTDAQLAERVMDKITIDSDPIEDTHYLIVLARIGGVQPPFVTKHCAKALLDLDRKIAERKLHRDSNWPPRIRELHDGLVQKDPKLNDAILADPSFGRADHVLFAQQAAFDRRRAAEIFLQRAKKDADFAWSPALVDLLAVLPAEHLLPLLRERWTDLGLRDSIVKVLARDPRPDDRDKFVWGLQSSQPATIERCLAALSRLPKVRSNDEIAGLIQALAIASEGGARGKLRDAIVGRLKKLTGADHADRAAWLTWLAKKDPSQANRLTNLDGVDLPSWKLRLGKLNWPAGEAKRGSEVFNKTGCATCHSGARALGPDLAGIARRFSRDDLLTAIIQPSRDVSQRYQTTLIETVAGTVYRGMIVYEAVDGVILQTGPDQTIRIAGDQIDFKRSSPLSLMPAGLLDKLSDQQIVDLLAYLKTLGTLIDTNRR